MKEKLCPVDINFCKSSSHTVGYSCAEVPAIFIFFKYISLWKLILLHNAGYINIEVFLDPLQVC